VVLTAPEVLIAFRAVCALAIFALACFGARGGVLAAVLIAGFVSDILDGMVARRLGAVTPVLRHADTRVDTVFYVAGAVALRIAVPGVFDDAWLPLAALVAVHVSRSTFELAKFGRLSSYHMWSSKLLGVLLVTAMTRVLVTGQPSAFVPVAMWLAVANELEGFTASLVLPAWRADVPSAVHAFRLAR
jgi:phosphatidylglycerophosphate synthase